MIKICYTNLKELYPIVYSIARGLEILDALIGNNVVKPSENKKQVTYKSILWNILNQINGLVIHVNKQDEIIEIIGRTENLIGFHPGELLGKKISEFIFEEDRTEWLTSIRAYISGEKADPVFIRLKKKDDSIFFSEMQIYSALPEEKKDDDVYYVFKEARKLHPFIHKEKLITLGRLGQLAAEVAHEIRNPLTSLQGFIQLLKLNPHRFQEYLQIMEDELLQIERIATELMLFAKPHELEFRKADLVTIVERCLNLMEGDAYPRGVEFIRDYELKELLINCDEQKIKQVLINLIKNALEAMDQPGYITIKISKSDAMAVITIEDQGSGIPVDMIDRVTEPFYTTKPKGSGLGLLICKRIIEGHSGFLKIKSKEGVGTTCEIALPVNLNESVEKTR